MKGSEYWTYAQRKCGHDHGLVIPLASLRENWRWEASGSSETLVSIYSMFHNEEDPNLIPHLHEDLKYHEADQIPSANNTTYNYDVTRLGV